MLCFTVWDMAGTEILHIPLKQRLTQRQTLPLKMEDPKIDPPIFMIYIALSVFTSKQGGTNYSTWALDIELCMPLG